MAKKIGAPEALTEAAIWHARIAQHPALAQDEKFLAWLCVARNRERYAAIANTWDVMGMIAASPHVLAIRRSSLKSVSWRAQRASMAKRAAIGAAFAAGVAIALVAGAQFYHANFASQTYQTARLERRVLTLQDGSSIALDADT
ncbi:MAG TPA: hypothetical protein VJP88_07285, partial [Caulobacteraceae bacterium]|nr:hypothetical protein [Caulobacteraceae bacterium]